MEATVITAIALGCAGLILIIIGIPLLLRKSGVIKKCTATTIGKVVDYKFRRGDIKSITPIVEFQAEGGTYRAYRHYSAVKNITTITPSSPNEDPEDGFYITEKDVFVLKRRGKIFSYRDCAEKTWPLNSSMNVIYNPDKPKQAFVEKVIVLSGIAGIVMLLVGGLLAIAAAILFFVF